MGFTAQASQVIAERSTDRDYSVWHHTFQQRPHLNAAVLITNTAPTLAQMALRFAANPNWEVAGTNMTSALCTFSTRGGITLTTAGAAEDASVLGTHADTTQTQSLATDYATDDELYFRARIYTGASISDYVLMAGFGLTLVNTADFAVGNDNESAWFRYEDGVNSGNWQVNSSDNGTDDTINTTTSVAASTLYDLELAVNASRVPRFYINGSFVGEGSALGTGHDLVPLIGVHEPADGGGAAKAFTVIDVTLGKRQNA